MKTRARIQALRAWLAAIMIIIPTVMSAESRSEAGSIVVQDGNTETAQLSAAESEAAQKAARKAARRTLRGYRGFVELGGFFNTGVKYYEGIHMSNEYIYRTTHSKNGGKIALSTSHGFQFNNYFFLGGGVALDCHPGNDDFNVPIFVNARTNILNSKVSPTMGMKLGGYFGKEHNAWFCAYSVGCRIACPRETAVVIGIEYYIDTPFGTNAREEDKYAGIGLTLSYEF